MNEDQPVIIKYKSATMYWTPVCTKNGKIVKRLETSYVMETLETTMENLDYSKRVIEECKGIIIDVDYATWL